MLIAGIKYVLNVAEAGRIIALRASSDFDLDPFISRLTILERALMAAKPSLSIFYP